LAARATRPKKTADLMDRTNLHWFTRSSIEYLFMEAAFNIQSIQTRFFPQSGAETVNKRNNPWRKI